MEVRPIAFPLLLQDNRENCGQTAVSTIEALVLNNLNPPIPMLQAEFGPVNRVF